MTGPIIPADQWPKGAVMHVFTRSGEGAFMWHEANEFGGWSSHAIPSGIPMPAGWDWRVPVMRPSVVAKGGEQIADIVADWDAGTCAPYNAMMRIKDHLDALTFQPGNDLHIGYEAGMKLARVEAKPAAEVVRVNGRGVEIEWWGGPVKIGDVLYVGNVPTIDLELVREAVEVAIAHTGPNDASLAGWQRMRALIDGQAMQPAKGEGVAHD